MISFIPWLLYPQGNCPNHPLAKSLCGPQSQSGCCGEERKVLPLPRIKPGQPACSLSLHWMSYSGSLFSMTQWKMGNFLLSLTEISKLNNNENNSLWDGWPLDTTHYHPTGQFLEGSERSWCTYKWVYLCPSLQMQIMKRQRQSLTHQIFTPYWYSSSHEKSSLHV